MGNTGSWLGYFSAVGPLCSESSRCSVEERFLESSGFT